LLLAILELIDRGEVSSNHIELSPALVERYKELFDVVRAEDDQPNPHLPLYHLSGDGFWHLVPESGRAPVYQEGNVSAPKSLKRLREETRWAEFDPDLWRLLENPASRHDLRDALIARYFADSREPLMKLLAPQAGASSRLKEESPLGFAPARDAAFRKTIRDIYDYRCAACGIRVRLNTTERRHVLIEAAHLVPWEETHNDNPTNGIALCRNDHWALDQHLIAPCPSDHHPGGVWSVSPALDDRIPDHKPFLRLQDRRVLRPRESKFLPSLEALAWRESHLLH
jgi:putative restriction endonuclease